MVAACQVNVQINTYNAHLFMLLGMFRKVYDETQIYVSKHLQSMLPFRQALTCYILVRIL